MSRRTTTCFYGDCRRHRESGWQDTPGGTRPSIQRDLRPAVLVGNLVEEFPEPSENRIAVGIVIQPRFQAWAFKVEYGARQIRMDSHVAGIDYDWGPCFRHIQSPGKVGSEEIRVTQMGSAECTPYSRGDLLAGPPSFDVRQHHGTDAVVAIVTFRLQSPTRVLKYKDPIADRRPAGALEASAIAYNLDGEYALSVVRKCNHGGSQGQKKQDSEPEF